MKLVRAVRIGGMDGDLGRRQPEDQPAVADVVVGEAEHVAQERAIGLRFALEVMEWRR